MKPQFFYPFTVIGPGEKDTYYLDVNKITAIQTDNLGQTGIYLDGAWHCTDGVFIVEETPEEVLAIMADYVDCSYAIRREEEEVVNVKV